MFHAHRRLIELSAEALDGHADSIELEEIQKGGSERRFFRLRCPDWDANVILLEYAQGREENNYYVEVARFLERQSVPAPRVLSENEPERTVWMEDLGSVDLHDLSGWEWERRRSLYEKALVGIGRLHQPSALEAAREVGLTMMPGFDEASYRWERAYFRTHYLGTLCGQTIGEADWNELDVELADSAAELLNEPAVLVHRDFQSQNIMVTGEARDGVAFIDFQGMRPGVAAYDLASLLFDPYPKLSPAERDELMGMLPGDMRREVLLRAGVQRLMQALGAYGNLGGVLGKEWFLQHVPTAEGQLLELAGELGLRRLQELIEKARPARTRQAKPE